MSLEHSPARAGRKLRTPEAADYLGISSSTLSKWRCTGAGPIFAKLGKVVTYDMADLDAWWEAQRRSSTSQAA